MKIKMKIIFLIFLSVLLFCSCSSDNQENKDFQNSFVEDIPNTPIKISRYEYDNLLKESIDIYKAKSGESMVEETVFSNYEEYFKKLSTELMAGKGPDVIIAQQFLFPSLRKTIESNVFFDINQLLIYDKDLKLDNFNKVVFDCGIINGKRYFIPIGYTIPVFWTTKTMLTKQDFKIDLTNWSLQSLDRLVQNYIEQVDEDRYFFSGDIIQSMIFGSGIKLIDYEKKKAYFNSTEFIELLKYIKNINKTLSTFEIEKKYKNGVLGMLKDGAVSIVCNSSMQSMLNPGFLWMNNSEVYFFINENIKLIPFPNYYGKNEFYATPVRFVAINSNSRNKKAAYDFIKVLLSNEIQSSNSFQNIEGIPVNNTAFYEMLNKYSKEEIRGEKIFSTIQNSIVAAVPLPNETYKDCESIIKNTKYCNVIDYEIQKFIYKYLDEYLAGKCSEEEAAHKLNNEVMLFLNE